MITGLVIGGLVLIMIGYVLFQLKAASANGRLLMWKISCLAIAEVRLLDMVQMDLFLLMGGLRKNILQMENIRRRRNW